MCFCRWIWRHRIIRKRRIFRNMSFPWVCLKVIFYILPWWNNVEPPFWGNILFFVPSIFFKSKSFQKNYQRQVVTFYEKNPHRRTLDYLIFGNVSWCWDMSHVTHVTFHDVWEDDVPSPDKKKLLVPKSVARAWEKSSENSWHANNMSFSPPI